MFSRADVMTVRVKCVICGHRWDVVPASEMPVCPKCMGPVTVIRAERKQSDASEKL